MNMNLSGPDPGVVKIAGDGGMEGCPVDHVQDLHTVPVGAFTALAPQRTEVTAEGQR